MPRPWSNLSDYEFEAVVGALLGKHLGVRFERFTRGKDLGIDLRHIRSDGTADIIQAKHFWGSPFATLKTKAKQEADRVSKWATKPASYRLVTSLGLTLLNKRELAQKFLPLVIPEDHVLGRDDLEQLMDEHPEVERAHVKLWLMSGTQLQAMLNSGIMARSRALLLVVQRTLPLYVQNSGFYVARKRLRKQKVILISGPPGIGKTTLAHMLIAGAIQEGFEPFEVSEDISEAWRVLDPNARQVFLFDDFLGHALHGELNKNEDQRLVAFMKEASSSASTLFILTTREYILQHAVQLHECFRRQGLPEERFLLELAHYSTLDRAKILRNHIWHSPLPMEMRESIKSQLAISYKRIVYHKNFNPRIIEYITGHQRGHTPLIHSGQEWLAFALASLEHPAEIWRQAFEQQLNDDAKALLLCLCCFPDRAHIDDLQCAFESWIDLARRGVQIGLFNRVLRVVVDTFAESEMLGKQRFVRVSNPGLLDFLYSQLRLEPSVLRLAIGRSVYFEQLQSIWKIYCQEPNERARVVMESECFPALTRLIDGPGATWQIYETKKYSGAHRDSVSADERLAWITSRRTEFAELHGYDEFLRQNLLRRAHDWKNHRGRARAAVRVVSTIPEPQKEILEALAKLLTGGLQDIEKWILLVEFIERYPDHFSAEDTAGLKDEFETFSSDELTRDDYEDYSVDDVDSLEFVAGFFRVELDPSAVDEMREAIEKESQRARDGDGDGDDDDERDIDDYERGLSEGEEIARLFEADD